LTNIPHEEIVAATSEHQYSYQFGMAVRVGAPVFLPEEFIRGNPGATNFLERRWIFP
jgi:hypothetical protein